MSKVHLQDLYKQADIWYRFTRHISADQAYVRPTRFSSFSKTVKHVIYKLGRKKQREASQTIYKAPLRK